MCNLYRMTRGIEEVARLFNVTAQPGNAGEVVYPGHPGLVYAAGELRSMAWGFPLALKSKKTGLLLKPKPVNNARADKLDGFMWRYSFQERRCLIPLTAFAEAEGKKGAMTRTWFSLPDEPIFAIAGIWRHTDEWGPAYSMVMTDACIATEGIHSRMPVILSRTDHARWTSASSDEALDLCVPYEGKMVIERTDEPWVQRKAG